MPQSNVTLPNGQTLSGQDVQISEQTEKWSEIKLEDGTVLRVKPNVFGVVRIDGQYDPEGNPLYAIKSQIIMIVASTLPQMKKGAATGRAN